MTSVRLAGNNFIIKFNIFIFLYFYEKCRVSYVVRTGTRSTILLYHTTATVRYPGYTVPGTESSYSTAYCTVCCMLSCMLSDVQPFQTDVLPLYS